MPLFGDLSGARSGERAAVEEAVNAHYEDALRLAWLLLGDRGRAEDAAAEALAKTLRRWQSMENPRASIRRAVVNEVDSGWRRLLEERRRQDGHGDERGLANPGEPMADRDLVACALGRLSLRQRAAVVLCYYEDLPREHAADALGCSVGAVGRNLSRGLANLRASLEGAGGSG